MVAIVRIPLRRQYDAVDGDGNIISDGNGIGGAAPQSSFIGGQQWAMNGQG